MKTRIQSILIVTTLISLGLLPHAQAVSPAPDGCYPGFTTAEGCNALNSLTTGAGNTGVGWRSLFLNSTGGFNTGVGGGALALNNGNANTAVGAGALLLNTTGHDNVAVGIASCCGGALFRNTTGAFNTAVGGGTLSNNTVGGDNTAIGAGALQFNVSGNENVAVGLNAINGSTGNNNVALGNYAGFGATTGSNNIYIGYMMEGAAGESNACYIGSIFGQTNNLGTTVFIDANGKLGTSTSSKRFKEDIQQMGTASEALFALKPVTFHYKKEIDPAGKSQFGLVAEDVDKVNPDLVARDKEGKPYSVRYEQVNAMLLNEFLKAHRKMEEQQKQIDALAAQLQKVSAQVQMSKSTPQLVQKNTD